MGFEYLRLQILDHILPCAYNLFNYMHMVRKVIDMHLTFTHKGEYQYASTATSMRNGKSTSISYKYIGRVVDLERNTWQVAAILHLRHRGRHLWKRSVVFFSALGSGSQKKDRQGVRFWRCVSFKRNHGRVGILGDCGSNPLGKQGALEEPERKKDEKCDLEKEQTSAA